MDKAQIITIQVDKIIPMVQAVAVVDQVVDQVVAY